MSFFNDNIDVWDCMLKIGEIFFLKSRKQRILEIVKILNSGYKLDAACCVYMYIILGYTKEEIEGNREYRIYTTLYSVIERQKMKPKITRWLDKKKFDILCSGF